jgi:tRNA(Ile2) C34 agmatinyltransferase TiaS
MKPFNESPTVICPFCDQRIKSSENLVRCRNCGEVFERELEDFQEDERDANFF